MSKWYAVELNWQDNDWGTGSYDYEEAVEMAHRMNAKLIAIIENDECIDILTEF